MLFGRNNKCGWDCNYARHGYSILSQAYNIDLSLVDYLMVILTATLASIGTAGVPGVGVNYAGNGSAASRLTC